MTDWIRFFLNVGIGYIVSDWAMSQAFIVVEGARYHIGLWLAATVALVCTDLFINDLKERGHRSRQIHPKTS